MQSQCTASNIRMAARRIDSYLERFAHLSASKSALSLSLSVLLVSLLAALSPKCEFGRFISGGQFRSVLLAVVGSDSKLLSLCVLVAILVWMEAIKMLVRISLKTRRPKFL